MNRDDFRSGPAKPLMPRKTAEQYPPFSGGVSRCLTGFPGETGDSGYPGLDGEANPAVFSPCQERFLGQCREGVPDLRLGLILGDSPGMRETVCPEGYFHEGPKGPVVRREGRSLRPPIFPGLFPGRH